MSKNRDEMTLGELQDEIKKVRRERDNLKLNLERVTEQRDKYKKLSEQYGHLTELKKHIDSMSKLPVTKTHTLLRVKDVTNNASGFLIVTYTIQGTTIVGIQLSKALLARSSAEIGFKVAIGNDIMSMVNKELVEIEWKDGDYVIAGMPKLLEQAKDSEKGEGQ